MSKTDRIKEIVRWISTEEFYVRQYRTWLKKPQQCYCCWHKIRKFVAMCKKGEVSHIVCTECARLCWLDITPSIMEVNDDYLVEQLVKKFKVAYAETTILECLQYREDIATIVSKACDKLKDEINKAVKKEIDNISFNQ